MDVAFTYLDVSCIPSCGPCQMWKHSKPLAIARTPHSSYLPSDCMHQAKNTHDKAKVKLLRWTIHSISLRCCLLVDYLLVVIVAIVLTGSNVIGFTKCSKQASKQIRDMAQSAITTGLTVGVPPSAPTLRTKLTLAKAHACGTRAKVGWNVPYLWN